MNQFVENAGKINLEGKEMIKYFVSYAHLRGFGNIFVYSTQKLTENDINDIQTKIKEQFNIEGCIILNFIEMENKND